MSSPIQNAPSRAATVRALIGLVRVAIVLSAIGLTAPVEVVAAADKGEKEARGHFQKAETAFNLGKFDDALKEYEAAYEAKALPGFLFNIAQCYRNLDQYERARFFYQRYLALDPDTPNRKMVEDLVADVDRHMAEQKEKPEATVLVPAPAAPATLPPPEPVLAASASLSRPPERKPLLQTWWFWTGVGVVVTGSLVASFLLTGSPREPTGTLGSIDLRQ